MFLMFTTFFFRILVFENFQSCVQDNPPTLEEKNSQKFSAYTRNYILITWESPVRNPDGYISGPGISESLCLRNSGHF